MVSVPPSVSPLGSPLRWSCCSQPKPRVLKTFTNSDVKQLSVIFSMDTQAVPSCSCAVSSVLQFKDETRWVIVVFPPSLPPSPSLSLAVTVVGLN